MSDTTPDPKRLPPLPLHIAGCIAFLVLPIIIAPRPPMMPFWTHVTLRDLIANCIMLVIFYFNYYQFIPNLYFKRKRLTYAAVIVAGLLVISIVPSLLTGHAPWDGYKPFPMRMSHDFPGPLPPGGRPGPSSDAIAFFIQVKHNILLYCVVILFSILLRVRMKLLETEILKHNAEMGTLKNQINPHFLFNTLNNIYAFAVRERASLTATSILKLSGMMRYVVTETATELVSLQKEINYTNDYIDLVRMRVTESMHLSYVVSGTISDQRVAPLVLMPFIENAFKHGVNPDQESYISIRIDLEEKKLSLTVENQKVQTNYPPNTRSGIGIENTRARLELLYPKKFFLSINEDEHHYRVQLTIDLS